MPIPVNNGAGRTDGVDPGPEPGSESPAYWPRPAFAPSGTDEAAHVVGGRFRIVREIGRGGVGLVYQAVQTSMNRPVAVKVLNPQNHCDDGARARFRQEAAAASRLHNPHTVSVYDFGEDENGELYLVMELLDGRPVSAILKGEGPFSADRTADVAGQVLDSLAEAHGIGMLHRDLKPDNIFLLSLAETRTFVKVLDFGLARMMNPIGSRPTRPGIVFGTPAYMSPEQVLGRDLDARSDLYSLAVVMFQMMTGALPVAGRTALELGVRKTRVQPLKLEDANPNLDYPPGAHLFFQRTLALNPALRPANTEEFRQLMTKSMERKPAGVRGGRRQLHDIYHAAPTLPENAAPFNRDVPEVPQRPGVRPYRPRNTAPVTAPMPGPDPDFIDEALKREPPPPPPRMPGVIGTGPRVPGDRRKARRGARLAGVKCLCNGEEYQATATDLSATGAFISSAWLPENGARVTVLFKYPGGRDWAVSILAEVTRLCPGPGARGEVRGFGVTWLKLRAVGDLDTVYQFLNDTLGIQKEPQIPTNVTNNQWEFIFEAGGLG